MSISLVKDIAPWLAPPLLGGVIGYVASAVSVRMILSRSGRRFLSNLITPQTLRGLLSGEKTVTQLSSSISSATEAGLNQPLSRVMDGATALLGNKPQAFLSDAVRAFLGSRGFIYATRELVGALVESLSSKRLREILGGPGLKAFVTGTLVPKLAEEKKRSSMARSVISMFTGNATTILDDRLLDELAISLEPYAPQVADKIVAWLKSSDTRAYLSDKGRELLPRILEKLNVMQRFLLSAGQFDKRMTEKMPEIVDETITTLETIARDTSQQQKVLRLLVDIARDMRDGLAKEGQGKGLAGSLEHIIDRFLQGLADPDSMGVLYDGLRERILADDPTVAVFLQKSFGKPLSELAELASLKVLELATKAETVQAISTYVTGWADRYLRENSAVTLKDMLHVDSARKAKLDDFLLQKVLQALDQRVPEIHALIDLESRVMPAMVLRLKWIDFSGAVLGILIGLFQLVLRSIGLT